MIPLLQRAARTARKASTGHRVVVVRLSEEGFVVAGRTLVKGKEVGSSREVDWTDLDTRPDLLLNAITLVSGDLERAERQGA